MTAAAITSPAPRRAGPCAHSAGLVEGKTVGTTSSTTTFTPGFAERTGSTDSIYWTDFRGSLVGTTTAAPRTVSSTASGYSVVESFGLYDELSHPGLPGATPVTRTPGLAYRWNGADTMVLQDRLGSGRVATDGAGLPKGAAHFGGYGVQIGRSGNGTGLLGFAAGWGYERTDPGWAYLSQRYYDSATGRFLSRDPIRWAGGLNLYGYCGADPVNGVDPSGLGPGVILLYGSTQGRPVRHGPSDDG